MFGPKEQQLTKEEVMQMLAWLNISEQGATVWVGPRPAGRSENVIESGKYTVEPKNNAIVVKLTLIGKSLVYAEDRIKSSDPWSTVIRHEMPFVPKGVVSR